MGKEDAPSEVLDEVQKSKLVKKVVETTRCSVGEAEIALYDSEWDVNTAVNSIIERPNNSEDWMEKKGRKIKKQEIKNPFQGRRFDNRNGGNRVPREARPIRENNKVDNRNDYNQKTENDGRLQNVPRKERTHSQLPRVYYSSNNAFVETANAFPITDTFVASTVATTTNFVEIELATEEPEKLSFAAVAAAKKNQPKGPLSQAASNLISQQPSISLKSPISFNTPVNGSPSFSTDPPISGNNLASVNIPVGVSTLVGVNTPACVNTSVGVNTSVCVNNPISDNSPHFVNTPVSAKDQSVEFVFVDLPSAVNDIEFAFLPSSAVPQLESQHQTSMQHTEISQQVVNEIEFAFQSSPAVSTASQSQHQTPQQQSDQQHQAVVAQLQQAELLATELQRTQISQQNNKQQLREPSLSFVNTSLVDYQSNDLRQQSFSQQPLNSSSGTNKIPLTNQQQSVLAQIQNQQNQQQQLLLNQQQLPHQQHQQPSNSQQHPQQQQHPSLQQQQQQIYTAAAAQFPNFGFPYMYSPVAAPNLRDVEQYTAMPFPYGLNGIGGMNQMDQLPMGAMIPPSMTQNGGNPQSGLPLQQGHQQQAQQQQTTQLHRSSISEGKYQQNSGNNSNSNLAYQNLGLNNQIGHSRNQTGVVGPLDNNALNNNGNNGNGVAPPPGFSGPPFITQPSFQSLFQLPSYAHPTMSFPLIYQGNTQQQRQPQGHHPQQVLQQPHQRPAEHNYNEFGKYPNQPNSQFF